MGCIPLRYTISYILLDPVYSHDPDLPRDLFWLGTPKLSANRTYISIWNNDLPAVKVVSHYETKTSPDPDSHIAVLSDTNYCTNTRQNDSPSVRHTPIGELFPILFFISMISKPYLPGASHGIQ